MALLPRLTGRRFALLFLLVVCFYGIRTGLNQRNFERYLNSLSITFDDFPADYSDAMIAAQQKGRPIEYDNYSTWHTNGSDIRIPPIIHFIWFKNLYDSRLEVSDIPVSGSKAPGHCQDRNVNFTVNVWNATAARALIAEHYEWFLPTYDMYKHPIQRVDAFKYFVLWHHGGIYMDLDIDCRRPLDPLLRFPAWFPKTALLGVNNDVFAARTRHPVIGEMTQHMKNRDVNLLFPYLTIYWSTGPQFASDVLKWWFLSNRGGEPYKQGANKLNSGLDKFYILPEDFYSETYTFFGHSPGGTWHGKDVAAVLWLAAHPWIVSMVVALPLASWIAMALRRRHLERWRMKHTKLPDA